MAIKGKKLCPDCKGRGRWQEQAEINGFMQLVWRECNTCHATGVDQDPEEGDAFDIGGDSYDDDN